MKSKILFILFFQITLAQVDETKKIMTQANDAYLASDFKLAKELYTNIIKLDPRNKDAWYNLAATELNLNETENACEYFYNVYKLGDYKAYEEIKKYCPNFHNGTILSIEDVEEKPKFIYEEKEHYLFENRLLNPLYLKILTNEIRKSKFLKDKLNGKLIVQFGITKSGLLDFRIIRYATAKENEEAVQNEITSIFRSIVKYIPAKNKGEYVDLWERWTLPLSF